MILDLEKLSSDERITGDEVVICPDVAGEENTVLCHVELDVRKNGDTYYIHVDLSGKIKTSCHKCLESASARVSPSFDLVVKRTTPRMAAEPEPPGEDFVRLPAGQNCLELDQYIYENLVVDIPMKITCREDCKGLCAGCGVNLNNESCLCKRAADPRWNELRKLNKSG